MGGARKTAVGDRARRSPVPMQGGALDPSLRTSTQPPRSVPPSLPLAVPKFGSPRSRECMLACPPDSVTCNAWIWFANVSPHTHTYVRCSNKLASYHERPSYLDRCRPVSRLPCSERTCGPRSLPAHAKDPRRGTWVSAYAVVLIQYVLPYAVSVWEPQCENIWAILTIPQTSSNIMSMISFYNESAEQGGSCCTSEVLMSAPHCLLNADAQWL